MPIAKPPIKRKFGITVLVKESIEKEKKAEAA